MDEYLYLTMAKLKADRLRLAREQRHRAPRPIAQPRREARPKSQPPTHPIFSLLSWR